MATGPKPARSPLEVLTNEGREDPFINQFWAPLLFGGTGFGAAVFLNLGLKRPMWSGMLTNLVDLLYNKCH